MMRFLPTAIAALFCLLAFGSGPAVAATLSRADLSRELGGHLRAVLKASGSELRLVSLHYGKVLDLPDGALTWELEANPDTLQPGRETLMATALVDGAPATTLSVSALFIQKVRVPVARSNIRRGDVVAADDFKWQEVELTRPLPGLVRRPGTLVGKAAIRPVRAGVALRQGWFDAPMAVDRGDRVRIQVVRGGLKIDTNAVALAKGRVGDLIQVRNPKSNVRYEARVTGPGLARVQAW